MDNSIVGDGLRYEAGGGLLAKDSHAAPAYDVDYCGRCRPFADRIKQMLGRRDIKLKDVMDQYGMWNGDLFSAGHSGPCKDPSRPAIRKQSLAVDAPARYA